MQRNLDARGWTNADLARATREAGDSVDESVIGRWRNRGAEPTLSSVRIIAKIFGRDIREAVVAAGLLTADELEAAWANPYSTDLRAVPDEVILGEVRRRMSRQRQTAPGKPRRRRVATQPVDGVVASPTGDDGDGTRITTDRANRTTTLTTPGDPDSTTVIVHADPPPPPQEDEGSSGYVTHGGHA